MPAVDFKAALAARKAAKEGGAAPAAATKPVNPPEADEVLETQTAPEVAGAPEPKEPEPEKKGRVKGKTGGKAAGSAAPASAPSAPAGTAAGAEAFTTEALVAALVARGYRVSLEAAS